MTRRSFANVIGSSVLPFLNPRVVCPPGVPASNGRQNILIATPMRSGTHLMMDLVLNNIHAYRTRPLYIDLDQCHRLTRRGTADLLSAITPDAGQIIKTHHPVESSGRTDPALLRIIEAALVVTVHRDRDAVLRSLARWDREPEELDRHRRDYDVFWEFWTDRPRIALEFDMLTDPDLMSPVLQQIAALTSTHLRSHLVLPPPPHRKVQIYGNKALTRILGRHAPRIDTTIHTLKR